MTNLPPDIERALAEIAKAYFSPPSHEAERALTPLREAFALGREVAEQDNAVDEENYIFLQDHCNALTTEAAQLRAQIATLTEASDNWQQSYHQAINVLADTRNHATTAESLAAKRGEALREICDELQDALVYVPEYLRKKWGYDEALAKARAALEGTHMTTDVPILPKPEQPVDERNNP